VSFVPFVVKSSANGGVITVPAQIEFVPTINIVNKLNRIKTLIIEQSLIVVAIAVFDFFS